jgi:hemerythrin
LPQQKERPLKLVQLVWQKDFESGDAFIDAQHQELFAIANQLLDMLIARQPQETTLAPISELLERITRHFQDEERILAELGYAELLQHATEHGWLIRKGMELLQNFKAGTVTIGEVVEFLSNKMIFQHMLHSDKKFFQLLRNAP